MNIVIWARVSTREQREGYSLDAQFRACRDRAQQQGWTIVREFSVAESAKRGIERLAFKEMVAWVRGEAKRGRVDGILCHKLDRACRNMKDATLLQDLSDELRVRPLFVENQFGDGAAGIFTFNIMAAVAQYYLDNLRSEVKKGMQEKLCQGWPTGMAAFGYLNVKKDRICPIVPHPEKSLIVARIFELFARGDTTLEGLPDLLAAEGHTYRPTMPQFHRTALSWILNNRVYIGEIVSGGRTYSAKFPPLVSRELFHACQGILAGRNRRTGKPELPWGGGFLRCEYCGAAMTGEVIRKPLVGGGTRDHIYYRCAQAHRDSDHPKNRWRQDELELAIASDLNKMRIPDPEVAGWLRQILAATFEDSEQVAVNQRRALTKQQGDIQGKLERLLNAYLEGILDEVAYSAKRRALMEEQKLVEERMGKVVTPSVSMAKTALMIFDFSQNAATEYESSNSTRKREILAKVSLNREVGVRTLCLTKRKPFDLLIEGPSSSFGRGDRIRTCDLLVPNQTL